MSKRENARPAVRLDDANHVVDTQAGARTPTKATEHAGDERWRCDPGTDWARYRGRGRRGRQAPAVDDDLDLRLAIAELTEARVQLAAAYRIEQPREQRPAVRAALAKIALAGRLLDDLVLRRAGEACDRFIDDER